MWFGAMLHSQVVFSETFDEADDAVSGSDAIGPTAWTATCPGSIAVTDYLKVVGNTLEARDTNGPGAVFETSPFDITTCIGLDISFDLEEIGDMEACADCAGTGASCIDWVKLEYNLDGGGWVEIAGTSCAPTMTEAPGEMIQIGDIGGGTTVYTSPCIDFGTTLQIRITCMCWAASEYWVFDNITVSCNDCVLPVEMINFEVEPQQNSTLLTWETLTETDNDYFAIERSYDGKNFEEIATVKGAGTSTNHQYYRFNDPADHPKSLIYYRIRQVDLNGKSSLSQTRSLQIEEEIELWHTTDGIRVKLPEKSPQNYTIQIFDLAGQIVLEETIEQNDLIPFDKEGLFILQIPELNYRKKISTH
jgi:hypothetical protein